MKTIDKVLVFLKSKSIEENEFKSGKNAVNHKNKLTKKSTETKNRKIEQVENDEFETLKLKIGFQQFNKPSENHNQFFCKPILTQIRLNFNHFRAWKTIKPTKNNKLHNIAQMNTAK